ncbi:MAG: YeeE/YedE family protein [Algiphilus sp.]|uniref:DUF6691 family protein n=1 Tax=Algiphilus sp. TaxID=1872431 RepID=UPI0032EABCAC
MKAHPIASLIAGALFGLGLVISGMVNPAKVLNFLDVAGSWDPTLAFVMGGALLITVPGFRLVLKRETPLLDGRFHLPERNDIDAPLIVGAILFGIGWGIGGFCPGPAVTAVTTGMPPVLAFVIAMLAGSWLAGQLRQRMGV